jgi:creatinine amidohydrolase
MRPWILPETNYATIKSQPYDAVVLPMGATEPHNLHLPYGTDTYQSVAFAERACEAAWKKGARVAVLPAIPYGTETNMQAFPLAMNVMPSTLLAVLGDLMDSLGRHKIRKLVILNGHGGNDFKPMLRELYGRAGVHLFLCDWFRMLVPDEMREIFATKDDHAGEIETSLILALQGDLVGRDQATGKLIADDGNTARTRFDAVNRGWVSITRPACWRSSRSDSRASS